VADARHPDPADVAAETDVLEKVSIMVGGVTGGIQRAED